MSTLNLIPVTSEKVYDLSLEKVYTFKVPLSATKHMVKKNVEEQFGVTVVNIKSLVQKGKLKAYSRGKRMRPGITRTSDSKKMYVTVGKDDTIKIFDEQKPEEETA